MPIFHIKARHRKTSRIQHLIMEVASEDAARAQCESMAYEVLAIGHDDSVMLDPSKQHPRKKVADSSSMVGCALPTLGVALSVLVISAFIWTIYLLNAGASWKSFLVVLGILPGVAVLLALMTIIGQLEKLIAQNKHPNNRDDVA